MYPPLPRRSILKCLGALLFAIRHAPAREVQNHGLWFERWLCDTFFDHYRPPRYTQKWDIPASANTRHGRLPVNPKTAKLRSPLSLGDALRQFDIAAGSQSFILIAGFWEQTSPDTKSWANVQAVTINPETWARLWHPVTRADLETLDSLIKDPSLSINEARLRAHALNSQPPFSKSIITLNPKIDRSQRRLQCSLSFNAFFDHLLPGVSRDRQKNPSLWGRAVPPVPSSAPRSFPPPSSAS